MGSLAARAVTDALDKLEKEALESCLHDGGPTSSVRDDEVKCGPTSNIKF